MHSKPPKMKDEERGTHTKKRRPSEARYVDVVGQQTKRPKTLKDSTNQPSETTSLHSIQAHLNKTKIEEETRKCEPKRDNLAMKE